MTLIAGIDIGSDYTQAALVEDEELIGTGEVRTKFDLQDAVDRSLAAALEDAGTDREDVEQVIVTGDGRKTVEADDNVTQYKSIGLALNRVWPEGRTVLLMGAKNAAALKLDEEGNVMDFDENDKCAAGVGRFLSDLTRYLDMDLDELVEVTLEADDVVEELNTQCSVFAESEVISLIHENVPESHISRGVHEAIAERNSSLIRRVGIEPDVLLIGGVARNAAFVKALEEAIDTEVQVPDIAAFVPAYGTALTATAGQETDIETDFEPGEKKGGKFEQEISG